MRMIYFILAIWGAVHPMYYFIIWFKAEGISLELMVQAWHANAATSGLVWDLTIAATTLTIWILYDVSQSRKYISLIAILVTFGIGVSSGLPLYLYLRSKIKRSAYPSF